MLNHIQPAALQDTLSALLATGQPVSLRWLGRAFMHPENLEAGLRQQGLLLLPGEDGLHALLPQHEQRARQALRELLANTHAEQPELPGLRIAQLRPALERCWQGLLPALLERKCEHGEAEQRRQFFCLAGHTPKLRPEDEALLERILPLLQAAGSKAPRVVELADSLGLERPPLEAALQRMALANRLVRVARNRYYLAATLGALAQLCEDLATRQPNGVFTAAHYRDLSGLGRNLTIEMLEFFDSAGLTRREGEGRAMTGDASLFESCGKENGRDTLPVERAGFKPDGRCLAPLGSSTLSSSATA